ncbi:MAG TPA: hypothetical protein V6D03_04920 [Candidatus Caenarcaniphilales bacterium]
MDTQPLPAPDKHYQLQFPGLPLAVYRELAAHLRQVEGVETGLVPQTAPQCDYQQSQVGGLWVQHAADLDSVAQEQVEKILSYYRDRYQDGDNQ